MKKKVRQLLLWSEKYTKTDMISLAKVGFWLNAGHFMSALSGVLLAVAFANLLSQEVYGIYTTVLSLCSIIAIPTLFSMGTAVTRSVAQGCHGTVMKAFHVKLRWGVFGALASVGLAMYYLIQGNVQLTFAFLIVAPCIPFMYSASLYDAFFLGKQKYKTSSQLTMILSIVNLVTMTSVLFLSDSLFVLLVAYFGLNTALQGLFFWFVMQKIKRADQTLQCVEEAISFGKHLSLIGVMGVIAKYIDKVLIWHFLGPVQVAIYTFATVPVTHVSQLFQPLGTLALSKFSQREKDVLKSAIPKKIGKLFLFSIPVTLAYIVFIPTVFRLGFPQYTDSIFFSQVFALSLLFQGNRMFAPYFNSRAQKKELYKTNIIIPTIKIGFTIVLLPIYGIMGVIIAFLGTQVFSLIFQLYLLKKF